MGFHHFRWNYKFVEVLFSFLLSFNFACDAASSILEAILLGTDHLPIYFEKMRGIRLVKQI